jgi:hypothetical protein
VHTDESARLVPNPCKSRELERYDQDEQLQGFENAFDEDAALPCPGSVVSEQVDVLRIGQADNRRELVATRRHHGRTYQIALLDIELSADLPPHACSPHTARWIGA